MPHGIENHALADVDDDLLPRMKKGIRVRLLVTTPPIYGPVLVVFGLPLAGLVGVGLFVYGLGGSELAVAASALGGAVCGLAAAVFGFRGIMRRAERRFRIVDVAEELHNSECGV